MAPYRVVQWSTGNIGKRALGILLDRDDFDVVGVHALGADKVGCDAGVLADRPLIGVTATSDVDALLDLAVAGCAELNRIQIQALGR